jgi:hypothetical protein
MLPLENHSLNAAKGKNSVCRKNHKEHINAIWEKKQSHYAY